jgi:hypothetical protein
MKGYKITLTLALILALHVRVGAALPVYQTVETKTPPKIDGRLDDPIWQTVPPITAFKTFKPDFGKEPTEKTEVFLTYDSTHLYIAFHCYDRDPGKIKTSMSKRDNIDADDWVGIALDTFGDKQQGYLFCVNPYGIQSDGSLNADGNGDTSLDLVWESHGTLTSDGYTVEIAIPFKSIRYAHSKKIVMNAAFIRTNSRLSEQSCYPELFPDQGALLSQLQPFALTGVKYEIPVEILPDLVVSQKNSLRAGQMSSGKLIGDVGLTGKIGVTSGLTLEATVNPDFSQVEADADQIDINLRSALYYSEKRPFFLEGLQGFSFSGQFDSYPLGSVVNTRTIVDPILGVKLNGKLSQSDSLSVIFALDEYPGAAAAADGDSKNAGQDAAVTVARYRHALSEDGYVGGFLTSQEWNGSFNRVTGLDGRLRLSGKTRLEGNFFLSFNRDGGGLYSGGDHSLSLLYDWSTRDWEVQTGYFDVSQNFQTAVGYLTRTGVRTVPIFVARILYPKSDFFQRILAFFWSTQTIDTHSHLFESFNLFSLQVNMPRNSQLRVDGILGNEVFADQRFNRNSWRMYANSQIVNELFLNVSLRQGNAIYYDPENPYAGRSFTLNGGLLFQPTDKLSIALNVSHTQFYRGSTDEKVYDYTIWYNRSVFQLNKYLFFRAILQYNVYYKQFNADFLASFTYIPGTVIYLGYGTSFEKIRWNDSLADYEPADRFQQTQHNFFFKASYLWRL